MKIYPEVFVFQLIHGFQQQLKTSTFTDEKEKVLTTNKNTKIIFIKIKKDELYKQIVADLDKKKKKN